MEKMYEEPVVEIIRLDNDVITTSRCTPGCGLETDEDPA